MAVFYAVLDSGDKVLGMDIAHGGHLTHGAGQVFRENCTRPFRMGYLAKMRCSITMRFRALPVVRSRKLSSPVPAPTQGSLTFRDSREIADDVGAYLFVDMAHIAGLLLRDCILTLFRTPIL